ncbi:hypothetical protein T439DRAFT_346540 [Meredithblackwellia eburnea MCA 4105]
MAESRPAVSTSGNDQDEGVAGKEQDEEKVPGGYLTRPQGRRRGQNKAKLHFDPIGPPSPLIVKPVNFARDVKDALKRADQVSKRLKEDLSKDGMLEQAEARCSIKDLSEETEKLHGDAAILSDLSEWHEERVLARGDSEAAEPEDGEEDEEPVDPDQQAADKGPKRGRDDPQVKELLDAAKDSPLQMLKPVKEIHYFVRRSKTADYNILTTSRYATPPTASPSTFLCSPSPLSSLLYTVTFHPMPKYTNRSPFPVRTQVLHLLGSTTLVELLDNLSVGGDGVPKEAEQNDDDVVGPDEWEWEGRKKKRTKWSEEKRVAGAVFAINGVLHADRRDGKVDYSELVATSIDSNLWGSGARPSSNRQDDESAKEEDIEVTPMDIDVLSSPAAEPTPEPKNFDRSSSKSSSRPVWIAGRAMQDVRIGELDVRVGEPYWFMHQGNCEHVWSVDSIRSIHPSDPTPTDPFLSSAPYPITTFLSRGAEAKCRLCDRDPGSIVVIGDELAGESPALLCKACFEMLHPSGEELDEQVRVVPTLLEW